MITSAEEFVNLRSSDRKEEYLRAANDPAQDETWLDVIRRFPDMRIWVVHNKKVSLVVLDLLAHDPDPNVRAAVATKNKLSTELFDLLASDPDGGVRERLAYNKKTPVEVLSRLAQDSSEAVSSPASQRLNRSSRSSTRVY